MIPTSLIALPANLRPSEEGTDHDHRHFLRPRPARTPYTRPDQYLEKLGAGDYAVRQGCRSSDMVGWAGGSYGWWRRDRSIRLASSDNDLLVLHPFAGIPIVEPATFLQMLR